MIRTGVRGTNQIMRYKTSLECVGNGVPQLDDLSNIVYLVRRCNFKWEVGELALITDYWNEAKFKHKHPVANLPASHHWILIYFRFQCQIHTQSIIIGILV